MNTTSNTLVPSEPTPPASASRRNPPRFVVVKSDSGTPELLVDTDPARVQSAMEALVINGGPIKWITIYEAKHVIIHKPTAEVLTPADFFAANNGG